MNTIDHISSLHNSNANADFLNLFLSMNRAERKLVLFQRGESASFVWIE